MNKVTIVALTKFPDVWAEFHKNIGMFVPLDVKRIVVVDGNKVRPLRPWQVIQGPEKFTMSGNYNLGMRAADPDSDLLMLNDDITFLSDYPVGRLQELAYSDPKIGAVACRVKEGRVGNPLQEHPNPNRPLTFVRTCGNGCTYFKREIIDKIGYMDEDFNEAYGAEDADYTWRINMAGYRVAIARDVHVKHGFGDNPRMGATHSATSLRTLKNDIAKINQLGVERFKAKHGHFDVHGEWDDSCYTDDDIRRIAKEIYVVRLRRERCAHSPQTGVRNQMKILIAVQSCSRDAQNGANQAIRDTWATRLPDGWDLRFFIGTGAARPVEEEHLNWQKDYKNLCTVKPQAIVQPPAFDRLQQWSDEVLVDAPDDYPHNVHKQRATRVWALEQGYERMFKCDTDTAIDWKKFKTTNHDYFGVVDRGWDFRTKIKLLYAFGGNGYWMSEKVLRLSLPWEINTLAEDVWTGINLLYHNHIKLTANESKDTEHLGLATASYRAQQMYDWWEKNK